MKVRVLGSAAGGGFPQWNCNCPNCEGYRHKRIRAKRRTQSSIALSADGASWTLCNASPDILTQLHDSPVLQPARHIRDTAITDIVLLDSQIDHSTGLLMLRESVKPLRIHCTEPVYDDLTKGNPLFNVLSHYCKVDWQPLRLSDGRCEFTTNGLRITAVPLKSKAPPYSPHRNDPHTGDNIGLYAEESGKRLFYSPGLGEIEPHVLELMIGADCVLVDGTFWTDDEMIRVGAGRKHARDMGHLPLSGPGGMIEVLNTMKKPRKILIHINNTNPILNEDSKERAELMRSHIEVADDGMEITL
jgi:pyrroloquinoline quinone biosynthesis protein B